MRRAVDGIAADADACALTEPFAGDLPDRLVGEGAGPRNDADMALLVDIAGGNADAAAAGRVGTLARRDNSRAVGTDETGLPSGHGALHPHHVAHGDALGNRDDKVEPGVDTLQDRVGGERRGHEDGGHGRAGGRSSLGNRIEDRNLVILMLEELAALARGDSGDDLRAVVERELRMAGAERAGDALDENLGFGSDENGHGEEVIVKVKVRVKVKVEALPRSE